MTCILLVEDNSLNRMLIEDIFDFDDIPATLLQVETGEEALDVAVRRKPVLILLDILLPGIDGLETARALKLNPATKDIPIWGISAQAMEGDEEKALAVGMARYITKPVDTNKLGEEIRAALSAKKPSSKRSGTFATP